MRLRRVLIPAAILVMAVGATGQQEWTLTDLGVLHPTGYSYSGDIDNLGRVTGTALAPNGLSEHAFLHDGTGMQDLGTLGSTYSWGHDINDSGTVVGYSNVNSLKLHAYSWASGSMTDEHVGPLNFSRANGINAFGDVTGVTSQPGGFISDFLAYATIAGTTTVLPTFGGEEGHGKDINELGQVVGYTRLASGQLRGFLWDNGVMTDLGDLGDVLTIANAMNNSGQIVGHSRLPSGELHAFLWEAGVIMDLGTHGGRDSDARDINAMGEIVGASDAADGTSRATIWSNGVATDLNTFLPAGSTWTLTGAGGINELGQISGTGRINGVKRAYRMDPVLAAPRMSGLAPPVAGQPSSIHVIGMTPLAPVFYVFGLVPGSLPIPVCVPGFTLGMTDPQLLSVGAADATGRAQLDLVIPGAGAGLAVVLQVVDLAGCAASNTVHQQIL